MDVNGLPMWLLAGAGDFGLGPRPTRGRKPVGVHWDAGRDHLTLASRQDAPVISEDVMMARLIASQPSPLADAADNFAWFNPATSTIEASGFAPGMVAIHLGWDDKPEAPPVLLAPSDMAMGDDQIVYIARDGEVILRDLRGRYPTARAMRADFTARLVAPRPGGGAWAFDSDRRRLAQVRGRALRLSGLVDPSPERFVPVDPNPDPPRILPFSGNALADRFDAVSLAASLGGRLALLAWVTDEDAALLLWNGSRFEIAARTKGLRFPWSLAWIGEDRVAVLAGHDGKLAPQAFVYPMDMPPDPAGISPEGRVYPLREPARARFCNRLGEEPTYLVAGGSGTGPVGVRRLLALSGTRYAREGSVLVGPIDSGSEGTVWHRFYLEASVPGHSAMRVEICARDSADEPALPGEPDAPLWAPHIVSSRSSTSAGMPQAAWCPIPSEIPATGPILACPPRPGESGLFTSLIQQEGTRVRRVTGRYAWLRIVLQGDTRDTPELAALRLYGKRFSYRDRYLPDFYGETLAGEAARAAGPATPPDFLERFLGLFEGHLTEIEGKVACSWALTDPGSAPDAALPWIGSWIGIAERGAERPVLLRERLKAAPLTAQLHGTLGGLLAELELATGGHCLFGGTIDGDAPPEKFGSLVLARNGESSLRALLIGQDIVGRPAVLVGGSVTRGDIVVVEGFRMRRTFATILGADLADEDDPLTLGLATSGNSFVGDTLILGDQATAELLSLYRPEIENARGDADGVTLFFEKLANRVLVLVRGVSDHAEMHRLRTIVEGAIPAHVEPQVLAARTPLIVGAASLVGIDTYLVEEPEPGRVRLNRSIVGAGDQIRGEGWLDGRADGPMDLAPVARARGPASVWKDSDFTLSALGSHAAKGRELSRYVWTWEH